MYRYCGIGHICCGSAVAANTMLGNNARSLGPALLAGGQALSQVWVFITAPLIGERLRSLFGNV